SRRIFATSSTSESNWKMANLLIARTAAKSGSVAPLVQAVGDLPEPAAEPPHALTQPGFVFLAVRIAQGFRRASGLVGFVQRVAAIMRLGVPLVPGLRPRRYGRLPGTISPSRLYTANPPATTRTGPRAAAHTRSAEPGARDRPTSASTKHPEEASSASGPPMT